MAMGTCAGAMGTGGTPGHRLGLGRVHVFPPPPEMLLGKGCAMVHGAGGGAMAVPPPPPPFRVVGAPRISDVGPCGGLTTHFCLRGGQITGIWVRYQ